ncbi:acyl-CoA dehydrogenase family protein [Streptomyces sp. WMMC940]|uniref:acyl-CoA dehydrogenase family protein n=1 Tax=Streptomyces sp. WMMC940 TaxID=3015153 RepID=UPI0022B5E61E|nr:acyl-CoA dehydrogenase family protein [Streptomyces sp. WMMC940]MCZ7457467.1 acyl-CoA/acyl-ACP dehydrogenase [Streptomyces sp. WMMC940]
MTDQAGGTPRAGTGDLSRPLTPEGDALLDILSRHLPDLASGAAEHDRDGSFPLDAFRRLGADGVLGATVPREFGGLGVSSVHDVCLAVKRIAEADASVALSLHMQFSRGITMSYEREHGTDTGRALAGRLLRLMGREGALVSGALKDAGVTTELVPAADGGWRLTGRKILVSMAPFATHFVVAAQTRPTAGPSLLASAFLPADAPGLKAPDNWNGMGMRASASTEVVFQDCPVPATDVFLRGPVGLRNDAAMAGQTVSSIGLLGVYAGIAQAARDFAVAGVARRGGQPAAVRTLVAELDVKLYTLRTALAAALTNADHHARRTADDPGERGRLMMAPFQYAKLVVNRTAASIVEDCMTLVGGASFTANHPLSRHYRDVRAGWFMQPFTYADAVDHLSAHALGTDREGGAT